MKRRLWIVVCLCLLFGMLPGEILATEESRSYCFDMKLDGVEEVSANPDQLITVTVDLIRTDKKEASRMYAVQTEIWYDDTFFELVEGSVMTAQGMEWTDMARRTGGRAFYLNFLSLSDGELWEDTVRMGSFQLRIRSQSGTSEIRTENCMVSKADGKDVYDSVSNHGRVLVSTDCLVTFDTGGGSEVPSQTVQYGERIQQPEEPIREGYQFNGWYSDLDRTRLWNFETDTVQGNMTLYAGWMEKTMQKPETPEESQSQWWISVTAGIGGTLLVLLMVLLLGKKKVTFDSCGGTPMEPVYVKRNAKLGQPLTPAKPGAEFDGWYTAQHEKWDFENGKVKRSMRLYAHWK